MASRAITIRVNPEAAQAYEAASAEERRKFDVLLSLKLTEVVQEIGRLKRSCERSAVAPRHAG
jgi:hypothetical protein